MRDRTVLTRIDCRVHMRAGEPRQELQSAIARMRPDAIVMGSHGRRGVDRWLLGSVTEATIRNSPVPVFAIPETMDDTVNAPPDLQRILVASDSTKSVESGIDHVLQLAPHAEARILHVVPRPEQVPDTQKVLWRLINDRLSSLDRKADIGRFTPEVDVGSPGHRILAVCERMQADIIIVVPHDKSWIERIFSWQTVEPVIRAATRPVLTIPEAQAKRILKHAS